MMPLKNPIIEDITIEVEGIVKDFFFYEDANSSQKIKLKLLNFMKFSIKSFQRQSMRFFHQGLSTILQVKKDIKY